MDENYMQEMARAYNERLRGSSDPTLNEIEEILAEQIAILEGLIASGRQRKLYAYVKAIKEKNLATVSALDPQSRIPAYRLYTRASCQNALARLIDLQIELFILLDSVEDQRIQEVIALETRATALLGNA